MSLGLIFKLGLPLFFLVVLFRLAYIYKEKKELKTTLDGEYSQYQARHYRFLTAFQMVMYALGILTALFFVYLVWIR